MDFISIKAFVIRTHRYMTITEMEEALGCMKGDIERVLRQEKLKPVKIGERTINYILSHPHMSWSVFLEKLEMVPQNLRVYYNALGISVPKKPEHNVPLLQIIGRDKFNELVKAHSVSNVLEATTTPTTREVKTKAQIFHAIADKYGAPNVFENMVSTKTPSWSL